LSGTLLNVALFGILRFDRILHAAGQGTYARGLLITMGFLSLFVSSVFVISSTNYKRMLAYSSIEHMGIISIGIGIGGLGVFAALFHMIGHSLTKSSFFLTSGNVHDLTGSNSIESARGLGSRDPSTSALIVAGFLGVSAAPPFSTFASELLLARALFGWNKLLLGLFLILVIVILYGMGARVLEITGRRGDRDSESNLSRNIDASRSRRFTGLYPQILLLAASAALGLYLPAPIAGMLHRAAAFLGG
ncbi:MAG TPA: proton-conducting transporter membrane subunit, partial [Spirochaetia bacterium]|nr:proton-conducting transporter membrane subunit [Spirochaetia bacterium]